MARLLYIETFPAKSASHSVPDGQIFHYPPFSSCSSRTGSFGVLHIFLLVIAALKVDPKK